MARVGSTPKGAAAPEVAAAIFQKEARDIRRPDSAFISYFEKLIAFGFQPGDPKSVLLKENASTFRDLIPARTRPRSPYQRARAEGVGPEARRAEITPALILSKRKDRTLEAALDAATPAELERLEAELPGILDARDAARDAAKTQRAAFDTLDAAEAILAQFDRLNPHAGPSRFRANLADNVAAARRAQAEASQAYASARDDYRAARGLPPAREHGANASRQRKPTKGRRKPVRWRRVWEADARRNAASESRKRSVALPTWKTLGDLGFVYSALVGAASLGRVYSLTLRLDDRTEALARTKSNPADWMRARINVEAMKALGRKVDAVLIPEIDDKGRLHFHGFVVAEPGERHALEEAMCQAGGPWRAWRNMQCVTHDNPPDTGWASYLVKDWEKASPWPRYSASNPLRRAAQAAFKAMRAFVLEFDAGNTLSCTKEKSTLTVHILPAPENPACGTTDTLLATPRHLGGENTCTKEHLRRSSSPTSGKACRSRDGPMPDGCRAGRGRIRQREA